MIFIFIECNGIRLLVRYYKSLSIIDVLKKVKNEYGQWTKKNEVDKIIMLVYDEFVLYVGKG